MPSFSKTSKEKLASCHPLLQQLFNTVIQYYDCTIVDGHRGEAEQNKYYAEGKSKLKFPKSKHNSFPSKAVDVAPFINKKGIVWEAKQMYHFVGFVKGVATMLGIKVILGADWDNDTDINDQKFIDLPHFELEE